MLDFVRTKQKSIIIKLVFGLIILSFVIGYAMLTSPGDGTNAGQPNVAVTVNGKAVAFSDFQAAYGNLYQLYQNIYQEQFTPTLERQLKLVQKSLDGVINQTLLLDEAKRQGLEVSKQELVDAIAKIPAFQQNGAFSKERYLQVLGAQRLSTEEFEEMQRRDLLVGKVRDGLQKNVTVSDAEIEQEFRNREEKVNLEVVRIAPAAFEAQVRVDDQQLAAFFEARKEEFRTAEEISLKFVEFLPQSYVDQVTFDDAELETFYRRNLDRFEIPEQARAAHILVLVPEGADAAVRAAKRAQAEKLLTEARGGKDFAALARDFSDDKASAVNGGDLGSFSRGTMVPAFEQAVFALKPGEISDLVETQFGYHIIKLTSHNEAQIRPLAEVSDEIKRGLRAEKSRQLALEKAMDAYNINRKGGSLEEAAKAAGLTIRETGRFARDGVAGPLGRNDELINAAFLLGDNELGRPVKTDRAVVLFALKERLPSRIPTLAEARARVEVAYRKEQSRGLAKAAAERLLATAKKGGGLATPARAMGQLTEETGAFSRAYSPFVPKVGTSEELAKAAFTLTVPGTCIDKVFEIDGFYVVAALKTHEAARLALLDAAQRKELSQALLERKQTEAVQKHLEELKTSAKIEIAPQVQTLLDNENAEEKKS
ncbi:MAG: SurA N-terminal domain-containing protein [Desulfuromonadales bacterium]